jgi:hypothetical protein
VRNNPDVNTFKTTLSSYGNNILQVQHCQTTLSSIFQTHAKAYESLFGRILKHITKPQASAGFLVGFQDRIKKLDTDRDTRRIMWTADPSFGALRMSRFGGMGSRSEGTGKKVCRSYRMTQPAETEEPTMDINPSITTHDRQV